MGADVSTDAFPERARDAATISAQPGGDLTQQLLTSDSWTDAMVAAPGIPVIDAPFVTVGGGIGSLVTIDYLRIAGVTTDRMRVLSDIDYPWQTYEYLTQVSQIPRPERIRSDSASRPDNIWGFPSYALSEVIRDKTLRPLWQVLVEPIWADYYTPRAGQVFAGLERESRRISYPRESRLAAVKAARAGCIASRIASAWNVSPDTWTSTSPGSHAGSGPDGIAGNGRTLSDGPAVRRAGSGLAG